MVRYFLAVTPPEPLFSRIETFRKKWGGPHHKVEPHITVKVPFEWAGNPAPVLKAAGDACAAAAPFELTLGAPGRFRGARVLFLSVHVPPALQALHESVITALQAYAPVRPGSHEGPGEYHPHLTLAAGRFGIDDAGLDAMEAEANQVLSNLPPFTVDRLRVYKWGPGEHRWSRLQDLGLGRTQPHV